MIDKRYLEFLDRIQKYFAETYHLSGNELYLARMTKLTEETGELASEVLSYCQLQRKQKLQEHSGTTLEQEWADTAGSLFLLGMALGIDMEKALTERMKVIGERYEISTNDITDNQN